MPLLHFSTMADQQSLIDENFPLFSRKPPPKPTAASAVNPISDHHEFVKHTQSSSNPNPTNLSFANLGLSDWSLKTCTELGLKTPTPVQHHCIPRILAGDDILGISQTGSGKTAAFALPILNKLAEEMYGVFCLVITPTRELAYQLAEQFKALGSCLNLKCEVVVGGMDMITQSKKLIGRPHVVIATPGRIKVLIEQDPDIAKVFSNTKFLVLDEADRVLDVGFEDELRVVFNCLPKKRQTLLFSATMTSNLQSLLEVSANKAYFYEGYEGLQTVETLKQQYVFMPEHVKEVYLYHILSQMEDMGIRSAIIFVSKCRDCHRLGILMEVLEQQVTALHSHKSQALRLSALHKFKSGKVPVLLATDVASRGLDIPTVDLVVNYDIPRDPKDYVHRVGRTARAGRGGLAISLITQNDVELIHKIEENLGKQMEEFKCKENEVLENITKVFKAKREAKMKMSDDGFDEIEKTRKEQKIRSLEAKGLLKKKDNRRKRKNTLKQLKESTVE